MNKIEIPIEAELVKNAELGIEAPPTIVMATIYVNHIIMVSEQTDGTALIGTVVGDVVSTLSYSDVKELLKEE